MKHQARRDFMRYIRSTHDRVMLAIEQEHFRAMNAEIKRRDIAAKKRAEQDTIARVLGRWKGDER
jgi:hypothetical protein